MTKTKYYLSIDIGASSGRHILTHKEGDRIICEEVYRFPNGNELLLSDGTNVGQADGQAAPIGSHRIWSTEKLFTEIVNGMKQCKEIGKIPVSLSIDTWGVDYVLLDQEGKLIAPCYAYRDARTQGMDEEVYKVVREDDLYARTGIQKAIFNTIYQLEAARVQEGETLKKAKMFLMIPDYFHYLLTGVACQEYTNATTTQLVNPVTKEWDKELIAMLGFPVQLFGPLSMPGTKVGELKPEIQQEVGFNCSVILPATHDTGSAVMSVPSDKEDVLYISSGTWSLLGCERKQADCTRRAQKANFTNEGGYDYRFRFLKNIMGLWMIQSVKKEFEAASKAVTFDHDHDFSFGHLCDRAEEETIDSLVDANDGRFLAPQSMVLEVQNACRESGQSIPRTPWEISRVIYRSLAECYRKAILELEDITGTTYDAIHVVGGGSNARWLNELTAQVTGKTVLAGPSEATAIGCVGAQMIKDGAFSNLKEFRCSVRRSFDIKEYRGEKK